MVERRKLATAGINAIGARYVGLDRVGAGEFDVGRVGRLYKQVWQWHGTGRYQIREGKVVDVLRQITQSGELTPHRDTFDPIAGEMYSVSTSSSRMYARLYAGMHFHEDADRSYLLGDTSRWVNYFMGVLSWEVFKEFKLYKYITPRRMAQEFIR